MKKTACLFAFAAIAIFFVAPVLAEPVSISVTPNEIKSDTDVNNVFTVTLTNNQANADSLKIVPNGPYIYWVTVPVWMADMQAGETKTFDITLFPTGDRYGRFFYTLTAVSINNPSISASTSFYLDVEPVRINSIGLQPTDGKLYVDVIADSLKRRDIMFSFSVRSGDSVIANSAFSSQIDGTQHVTGTIDLPTNLLAGNYTFYVEATTEGTTIKKTQTITFAAVHNIVKTRAEVDTTLYREVTITVKNMGNVVEDNYQVVESTDSNQLTGFITAPNDCTTSDGKRSCNYVISGLAPGASAQVVYTIEFWPTIMQYGGAIVAILAVLGFTFIRKTNPSLSKRSVAHGEGKHSIIIEIRNPFLHHLNNVIVRDFVHPVANVVHEEMESIKPVVRKTETGTELIWKLGDMKPKETRLLKYAVKSVFQGNTISSPKAYMRFMNPKGKSFRIYSNSL